MELLPAFRLVRMARWIVPAMLVPERLGPHGVGRGKANATSITLQYREVCVSIVVDYSHFDAGSLPPWYTQNSRTEHDLHIDEMFGRNTFERMPVSNIL